MTPALFPEANVVFNPPSDLSESQCMKIAAYVGEVKSGSLDGSRIVVTAWHPTPEELQLIMQGKPIYLSFIGGLPPHFPCLDFHSATHPA